MNSRLKGLILIGETLESLFTILGLFHFTAKEGSAAVQVPRSIFLRVQSHHEPLPSETPCRSPATGLSSCPESN